MGRAALENGRRFAPGPVVAQAERLFDEVISARESGQPVVPERGGLRRVLAGKSFAARDAAYAAASSALHTVRKGRR